MLKDTPSVPMKILFQKSFKLFWTCFHVPTSLFHFISSVFQILFRWILVHSPSCPNHLPPSASYDESYLILSYLILSYLILWQWQNCQPAPMTRGWDSFRSKLPVLIWLKTFKVNERRALPPILAFKRRKIIESINSLNWIDLLTVIF